MMLPTRPRWLLIYKSKTNTKKTSKNEKKKVFFMFAKDVLEHSTYS